MISKTCRLLLFVLCLSMLVGIQNVQAQIVSGQELVDTASNAIRQYTGTDTDSSVTLLSISRDVTVPDGNAEITASVPSGVRYNMPTLVYVNINVDGQVVSRNSLRFEVKLYQNVVVAARALAIHDILQESDLRYERLDIGRLPPGFLTSIDKAIGLESVNFVRPGTVLSTFSLRQPVAVKRGSTVNIIAKSGKLEVSTVGIAMQDGAAGQIIRVQNPNSRKFISVKVLDDTNVLATSANGR